MENQLPRETQLSMYESMLKQRFLDEKVVELFRKGQIAGIAHPCIGQEAVAAGVCEVLEKTDVVVSNHRGHGHSVAKGVPEEAILSELLGRDTGVCSGLGGSMHASDMSCGLLFSTAIVGGGIPIAVGAGLALKMSKKKNCVVCFFGDGAVNTGAFHEGLNMAAVLKLPVVFVCENNQYAISTPVTHSLGQGVAIGDRGRAYGMVGQTVDGMSVLEVYKSALAAVTRAEKGEGPTLLEYVTYRYTGHGPYDLGLDYRTQEEIDKWKARDPIRNFELELVAKKVATQKELEAIRNRTSARIMEATQFALGRPYPSPDLLTKFAWAEELAQ